MIPTDLGISTTDFLEKNFQNILDFNFTSVLEEELDEVANNTKDWKNTVKKFYDTFIPNVDKLNDKELVSKSKDERKRFLGNNEDNLPVYAYIAKFGPVLQIGDDKKNIKYIKIDEKYSVNTITLEDIKDMCKYPKKIGTYQDIDIIIKNGMYGFYISYNDKNYKFINEYDENLTLEEAINCIKQKDETSSGDNGIINKIDKYTIKNGPYGPYIEFNKKFFSIPKEYDINNLTKESCDIIIKIPKKKFVKK